MQHLSVDVAVIGAGTAGLTAYRAARSAGARVVLIEQGPHGTTCSRVGCMPSKLLIAAAEAAHAARDADAFGVQTGPVVIDGVAVMARVRSERDRFVGFTLDDVQAMPAEDKLDGKATFLSNTELQVGDHTRLSARAIIIATGTSPDVPALYQGLGDRCIVNDDVFDWTSLPRRVAVIGTGIIGLELGQALHRLGVQVSIFGRSGKLGGIRDPLVLQTAQAVFGAAMPLRLHTEIQSTSLKSEAVQLRYQTQGQAPVEEEFDVVLVATGRRPNLKGLGLEKTSATLDERGMPSFDATTLQVHDCPIFLAGDVNGLHALQHEAADDGRIAGRNAAQFPDVSAGTRRAPLGIVFSDPQIAFAGQRLSELKPEDIVIGDVSFDNQGRSRIMRVNQGLLRVYASRDNGRFLGAEMVGPAAEHIGHLLAWAAQQTLTLDEMLAMPFYHPVIEEGVRTALRRAQRQLQEV